MAIRRKNKTAMNNLRCDLYMSAEEMKRRIKAWKRHGYKVEEERQFYSFQAFENDAERMIHQGLEVQYKRGNYIRIAAPIERHCYRSYYTPHDRTMHVILMNQDTPYSSAPVCVSLVIGFRNIFRGGETPAPLPRPKKVKKRKTRRRRRLQRRLGSDNPSKKAEIMTESQKILHL